MPFRLVRFTATTPLAISHRCTDGPCTSGQEAALTPHVESGEDARFDAVYSISDGDAGFCEDGASELVLHDVARQDIPVRVRLCRGPELPPDESRIRVVVTVTERGGRSASRAAYIEVLPLGAEAPPAVDEEV